MRRGKLYRVKRPSSRDQLAFGRGAQAVILGCTEFPLLLSDARCPIPPVDSLKCHCEAIARYILDERTPEKEAEVVRQVRTSNAP